MRLYLQMILVITFLLNFAHGSFADTVYLKSGMVVQGKITQENEASIVFNLDGTDITYYKDEIEKVEKTGPNDNVRNIVTPEEGNWWKYEEVDAGEKQATYIRAIYSGVEDIRVAGISFKECQKESFVSEFFNADGSRDVEDCTVWSIEGAGMIKEVCSAKAYDPEGRLAEETEREKHLVSAKVDGKVFGSQQ